MCVGRTAQAIRKTSIMPAVLACFGHLQALLCKAQSFPPAAPGCLTSSPAFVNLTSLTLNCKDHPFPSLHLPHLRDLMISYLEAASIPPAVFELTTLESLTLRMCQGIDSIPDDIAKLSLLTKLCYSHPNPAGTLRRISPAISSRTLLEHVCFCVPNLFELRLQIRSLPYLAELCLFHSNVMNITDIIQGPGDLPRLESLVWGHKQLDISDWGECTPVPLAAFRPHMRKLVMPRVCGPFNAPFRSATSLTDLEISDSELSDIPEAIEQLCALTKLTLQGCKIRVLPSSVSRMTTLRSLCVRRNLLTSFPPVGALQVRA